MNKLDTKNIRNQEFKSKSNYFTNKRVLKLEQYDDNGNLIDTIKFNNDELDMFCKHMAYYKHEGFKVARKEDREYFSKEKLPLIKKILNAIQYDIFDNESKNIIDTIFNLYSEDQINFALNFKNYLYNSESYRFSMSEYHIVSKQNFIDVLDWIKNSPGLWYAMDDEGNKGMAYLNKPTKKQAKYQRTKNKMKIVFLNFKDMKEYLVNEDELLE